MEQALESSETESGQVGPVESEASNHLRRLCLIYTWVLLFLNILECINRGRVTFPGPLSLVYLALLGAYAGEKEFRQWSWKVRPGETPGRRGEVFVYVWTLFLLAASLLSGLLPETFAVPHELGQIVIQVIGVFLGTSVSKAARGGKFSGAAGQRAEVSDQILAILDKGPLTASQIAEKIDDTPGYIRMVLGGLQRSGQVIRIPPATSDAEPTYRLP